MADTDDAGLLAYDNPQLTMRQRVGLDAVPAQQAANDGPSDWTPIEPDQLPKNLQQQLQSNTPTTSAAPASANDGPSDWTPIEPDQLPKNLQQQLQSTPASPSNTAPALSAPITGIVPAKKSYLGDVADQLASGAAEGIAAIPSAPARLTSGIQHIANAAMDYLNPSASAARAKLQAGNDALLRKLDPNLGEAVSAALPTPQTTPGQYARTVGNFVPAALTGEGGIGQRVAQAAVPAIASQASGDVAQAAGASPATQDAIKAAVAIAAGVPLSKPGLGAVNPAVAAADRLGISVPKYIASDGNVAPALAQGVRIIPGLSNPITKGAQNLSQGLEDAINLAARPSAPDIAGQAAKDAITNNIKIDAPAQVSALYQNLEGGPNGGGSLTNPAAQVPLTNTMQKMQQLQAARANANLPEWSANMQKLAQAVTDPNGMNYAGIKDLRSYFGQGAPQTLIANGVDPAEAKQLYGPLTEDLKNAVYLGGGQQALDDFTEANALAKTNAANRQQLYKIIGAKADVAPEAVFSRIQNAASTGASANIDLLQRAKDAMGPSAWSEVGNAIIGRLGRDPQGNFSPDRFIGPNGYSGLSDNAKNILFTPQQKSALDDLMTVSNQYGGNVSKYANTSKTAHALGSAESLGAVWTALMHPHLIPGILGLAGTTYGLSRYLASPAAVQNAIRFGQSQLAGSAQRMVPVIPAITSQPATVPTSGNDTTPSAAAGLLSPPPLQISP